MSEGKHFLNFIREISFLRKLRIWLTGTNQTVAYREQRN